MLDLNESAKIGGIKMRTLLVGTMEKIEELHYGLNISKESFEVELIISTDNLVSEKYSCQIISLEEIGSIKPEYEIDYSDAASFEKALKSISYCSSEIRVLGLESTVTPFLLRKSIID